MSERRDFWSDRRAAVRAEETAEVQARLERDADAERAALAEKDDAEILAELNLPDPDQLTLGDDVSGFMAKAVPDRLRRRALRKLWRLNPVLANIDELVDYGEDFTDSATVIENLQTTYQVGKGMMAHIQELARQAEEAELAAGQEPDPQPDNSPEDEQPADEVAAEASTDQDQMHAFTELDHATTDSPPPAPRRMRFEFRTPS